jgi:hypothetical protein
VWHTVRRYIEVALLTILQSTRSFLDGSAMLLKLSRVCFQGKLVILKGLFSVPTRSRSREKSLTRGPMESVKIRAGR